ncbi:alpha/beta fold hydrolase [Ornithinibacillus xuwenensis]|uniref:Alpha/beta fold hydrolase n=1 Tax=Ornithinibacillus xuwenensis TaxID=3144668 RepID=A0ABU9XFD9_9BACI
MTFLNRESIEIHYENIKSEDPQAKETLVFIHGVGLDMNCWNEVIPLLKSNYHIVRYDLRGHGRTGAGKEERTIARLADDLEYLITMLDIPSCHLIAQGLGGVIAIEYAARNPEELKTLGLLAVPVHFPKELGKKVIERRKALAKGHATMAEMGQKYLKELLLFPNEEKQQLLAEAYKVVSTRVYFELFSLDHLDQAKMNLQRVTVPILVLSGSDDEIFPPQLNSAILNFNYHARCYLVPHASYLIQMDQPKITADWINGFIQKHTNEEYKTSALADSYHRELTSEMYKEIRHMLNSEVERSLPTLQVHIMRGFNVYVNDKRIIEGWGSRKAKQILMYLVIQQSSTRDELCDLFWPDVDLKNARNRLRVALHHLNTILHIASTKQLLVTEREHIYLQANMESDLLLHVKTIHLAHQSKTIAGKVDLYKRIINERVENPLPGLYETWFLNYRSWLEKEWVDISLFLADYYEQLKQYKQAIYYLEIAMEYIQDEYTIEKRLRQLKNQLYT